MISKCLICNYSNRKLQISYPYSTYFNKNIYKYILCNDCKSVYLLNNLTINEIKKMYDQKNYHSIFYKKKKFKHNIITKIKSIFSEKTLKICDFGCGNGDFLESLPKKHNKVGIEYSLEYINKLNSDKNDIEFIDYYNFFNKNNYHNFFDIIYLGDVLEHLQNPIEIMNNLTNYLSPNGYFIIEGPIEENYNIIYYCSKFIGYLKYIFKVNNTFTPFHIFRTNHKSQKNFFKNMKETSILSYETHETGWPYRNNGFLRNLISNFNFLMLKYNSNRHNRFIAILKKNKIS
tara:strand:- start:2188 stop:3054 length:867 start_codon:yes stop_codon:yes gene_type:complete